MLFAPSFWKGTRFRNRFLCWRSYLVLIPKKNWPTPYTIASLRHRPLELPTKSQYVGYLEDEEWYEVLDNCKLASLKLSNPLTHLPQGLHEHNLYDQILSCSQPSVSPLICCQSCCELSPWFNAIGFKRYNFYTTKWVHPWHLFLNNALGCRYSPQHSNRR